MGHNRKVNQSLELGEDQKKKKIDNIIESILNQRNLKLQWALNDSFIIISID